MLYFLHSKKIYQKEGIVMKKYIVVCLLLASSGMLAAVPTRTIGVLGTGYVGLVLGACLADFGHNVICADINKEKIKMLKGGGIPIYEPGLKEVVDHAVKNNTITFSDDPEAVIRESQVVFIAVDTPMSEKGKADLTAIRSVSRMIGKNLNGYKLVCTKSTVPIGTGKEIKEIISSHSSGYAFDIVSNPEFLKEGTAVNDFLYPDRVVIGAESEKAFEIMNDIYAPLIAAKVPFIYTDVVTAETIKYASNSFLAVKISFINEISHLCDLTGADVKTVARGMGLDDRIGAKFLNPGPGFGGSCFPKDAKALLHCARSLTIDLKIVKAALEANEEQKHRVYEKLSKLLNGELADKTVAVLGVAFKANTDDVRHSPATTLFEHLLAEKVNIKAYDPVAMNNMSKIAPYVTYCSSLEGAVRDADAVVVLTEWDEFKKMNLELVASLMNKPVLLDARNILSTQKLAQLGFSYLNIGNARVK